MLSKSNTSLRICDLKEQIEAFGPVKIFINDTKVWDDDDLDITDLWEIKDTDYDYWKKEVYNRMVAHTKKYRDIFEREDYVTDINFKIVHYHHTEVYVTLK